MALVITYLSGEKKTLVRLIGFGESGKGGDIYGVKAVSSSCVVVSYLVVAYCGRSNGQRCLVSGC